MKQDDILKVVILCLSVSHLLTEERAPGQGDMHIFLSPLTRTRTSQGQGCLLYSLLYPQHLELAWHIISAQYIFFR